MIPIELLQQYGGLQKKHTINEVIVREGQPTLFYHQLVEGKLKAINSIHSEQELLQYFVLPGQSCAEAGIFDNKPVPVTLIAETESTVIRVNTKDFLRLLSAHPKYYEMLLSTISSRLRFKIFLLKEVAQNNPRKAILKLLHFLKINEEFCCKDCHKILLTRQQIANLLGFRVETVIRSVKQLADSGILKIHKGKIYLPKKEKGKNYLTNDPLFQYDIPTI